MVRRLKGICWLSPILGILISVALVCTSACVLRGHFYESKLVSIFYSFAQACRSLVVLSLYSEPANIEVVCELHNLEEG